MSAGLPEFKVSFVQTAAASTEANYMASTNTMEHNFNEGVSVGQNIAGGPDPVSRWYDAEKVTYEKLIQEHLEYKDLSGYELMQKDEAAYKTVGHYLNIINPKATTIGVGYNTSGKYGCGPARTSAPTPTRPSPSTSTRSLSTRP